ncbi:MAG: sirohydrochlorin chelatase [Nitrososphaeraceae archaeon]
MKKALLLIDRGSREPEVKEELKTICMFSKTRGNYIYSTYCFLEVISPSIEDGINQCLKFSPDLIVIVPYFLYPGLKLKDSVKKSAIFASTNNVRIAITKPLCYSDILTTIIHDRIKSLKSKYKIDYKNHTCDVLLIGHGSSDRRATEAFFYTANSLCGHYRNVKPCFLELEKPNIEMGIKSLLETSPKVILAIPYFLHKGIHIKKDVLNELNLVMTKYSYKNIYFGKHIGTDERMIDLILERTNEVINRIIIKK